jgi:hypothetical protein
MSNPFASSPTVIQQAAPTPKPPALMPDTEGAAIREAKRKAQMDIMGRAGRQSTILTAPKDRGGDYTSRSLGAGGV